MGKHTVIEGTPEEISEFKRNQDKAERIEARCKPYKLQGKICLGAIFISVAALVRSVIPDQSIVNAIHFNVPNVLHQMSINFSTLVGLENNIFKIALESSPYLATAYLVYYFSEKRQKANLTIEKIQRDNKF